MKKESKILLKYFALIFLASALIINWQEVSWIFNYRAVFGLVSGALDSQIVARNAILPEKKEENIRLKNFEPSDKENSVEIAKIEISAPLVFVESQKEKDVSNALNYGVAHFPSSALPGEPGQTVILGHSAPASWPKIKYQSVFSRLNELTDGDEIIVYFERKKYTYQLIGKFFLERGEELPQVAAGDLTNSDNVIVLISCWPPGKDLRRIAVLAK